ncbi:MAG: hypothetical protein PHC53_05455 [Patescibacteria group bacterium]|nr:hypothetical protein [Patescibacteria group bacterium]
MTAEAELFAREGRSMESDPDIQILEDLLNKKNPELFGPYWIECQNKPLSARLRKLAKSMGGWQALADSLHEPWKDRFQQAKRLSPEQKEKRPYELARELANYLESIPVENRPKEIHPNWIHDHNPKLFEKLNLYVSKKIISWSFYMEKLPAEWQLKWQTPPATLEQDKKALKDLLAKEQPAAFSLSWLASKDTKLYNSLDKKIRKSEGDVTWLGLIKELGPEWFAKWKPGRRNKELEEMRAYEDESEVQTVLDEFKGSLYTMVTAKSPEEIETRNNLCGCLAALSQKGNVSAKRALRDLLELFLQETIDSIPSLAVYKMEPDKLDERYEACIAHWDPGKPFLKYLLGSLFFYSRTLGRQISMETGYGREDEADWASKVGTDPEGEFIYYPNRKRGKSA